MKYSKFVLVILFTGLSMVMLSCSTTSTSNKKEAQKTSPENNWTLEDHLRRASGVRVMGSGPSTRVVIRGESTTSNPSSQPLFIIDGQKAGQNFSQANEMLYEGEIKYIEVLPPSRTARYGMEGHYGVILIHTRTD